MKFLNMLSLSLFMVTFVFAGDRTISFARSQHHDFCAKETAANNYMDVNGAVCDDVQSSTVRIRVFNPKNSSTKYGFALERPFFVLDGIYLSTDGLRTLDGFQQEVDQIRLTDILLELGYTPVLVQFSETVTRSLEENATDFSKLLRFMNGEKLFKVSNRQNGFVVMGISQGGILGRYGAYLYDVKRSKTDAPIRLYASLDSPHQGAVLPLSLYYTIDFWATLGGSAEAEAFKDLVEGPGASGLLLYDYRTNGGVREYYVNTSTDRFLFGEYRKAAEYKGFPSVLIAQGQLKGKSVDYDIDYFKMNRRAKKGGTVMGRAISEMVYSPEGKKRIAHNRVYKKWDQNKEMKVEASSKYDFVQGSTYPFAETMYRGLKAGFDEAIPSKMSVKVGPLSVELSTGWDENKLEQKNSTFIPVVSAMDMKCDGNLAINENCAFKQNSEGFPFTNPGSRSTAKAAYAVDPTHPRYGETSSGRHVELPDLTSSEKKEENVANGIRVDFWRMLCELANQDYNWQNKSFSNEKLAGHFVPGTNCMDQSRIPLLLHSFGKMYSKAFPYSRYMYAKSATELEDAVSFDVPAGWHKVSLHDNGADVPNASVFEVGVKVNQSKGNWMKAELLLYKGKNGSGQLQMKEIDVPMDGEYHLLRWNLPAASGSLEHYRWLGLVLNSYGANVTLQKPHLFLSTVETNVPTEKVESQVYPENEYKFNAWTESQLIAPYSDALGSGVELKFGQSGGGIHIDFDGEKSLEGYSTLKVVYWPGSCEGTSVYFDSFRNGHKKLGVGNMSGNFMVTEIPLVDIINMLYTPEHKKVASRLVFENFRSEEQCLIHNIELK